ncbi:uncharacterized protein METZ01_LOCUS508352, partial [marine metagenome]
LSRKQILQTEIGWCEPWVMTFNNKELEKFEILRINERSNSNVPQMPKTPKNEQI